jgi:hypothetical protein
LGALGGLIGIFIKNKIRWNLITNIS